MMTRIVSLLFIYSSLNFCCYGNLDKCDGECILFTFKCNGDKDRIDGSDEDYCNKDFISAPAQISTPDSPTYIAAVVEYHPEYATNSNETLKKNSDAYVKHIKTARVYNADIIVFPENGLTTVKFPKREEMQDWTTIIPSASSNYTPCTDSTIKVSEALKKISCAARNNTIYVVINIAEKLPCTEDICPKDKMFYYNSNVVFDRTGKIIARYRKTNFLGERQFNVISEPKIVIFDTDFGVKFGTLICFDILFYKPALQLTRDHQITDIVYSTTWFSEAPFLTVVQTQAGWSFSEDVNFLASGYNEPASGSTGSGIYLGREGIGKAIMSKTTRDEILVFEVPKKIFNKDYHDHSKDYDHKVYNHKKENVYEELWKKQFTSTMADNDIIFLIHDNINAFETCPLEGNVTKKVCNNGFCCDFKVEVVTIDPSKKYRLIASSGFRLYGTVEAGVRTCGIIQCLNDSVSSCGSVQDSKTVFSKIEINATFYDYKNILIMPSTLRSDLLPLSENWTYNEHTRNNQMHINMLLNNNTNNLTMFGIYSRYFKNDAKYFIALLVIIFIVSVSTRSYRNRPRERLVDEVLAAYVERVPVFIVLVYNICWYIDYNSFCYVTDIYTSTKYMLKIQLLIFDTHIAWLPCLVRPLRINRFLLLVCSFHFLLILFRLRNWYFSNLILANAHFLFVALRNSSHTLIIFVLILIYYLLI